MKWLALLLLGAGLANGCAAAQGLTLSPVMISAPAEGGAASLTLHSTLSEPRRIQVRVFDWTQHQGGEQMEPAEAVRFGPEIFEIAPGKSQTVRFLLPDSDGQGAWRVVVDELPPADGPADAEVSALSLRLRYVLSMFAGPAGSPAQLKARAGDAALELSNPGPGWLKLHGLTLVTADGAAEPAQTGIIYLLPGAVTRVPVAQALSRVKTLTYVAAAQTYTLDLRSEP